jgi:hypothetical protein
VLFDRRCRWGLPVNVYDFARELERAIGRGAKLLQTATRGLELPFESDAARFGRLQLVSHAIAIGAQLRQQERDLIVLLRYVIALGFGLLQPSAKVITLSPRLIHLCAQALQVGAPLFQQLLELREFRVRLLEL